MDDYSQFATVGGNAPTPNADSSITPQDYFAQVRKIYPDAVFNGGGRSHARNLAVGGAAHSMHLSDQAMDFNVPGQDPNHVFTTLRNAGLPMTESLAEGQVGNQGAHLHVGWAPKGGAPKDDYSNFGTIQAPQAQHDDYSNFGTVDGAGATSGVQPKPGAKGVFGQIGQTASDLFTDHPDHAPNALEQGIMGVANSKPVQGVTGAYQEAALGGLFAQPVRAGMEALDSGHLNQLRAAYPGQTDQWYHDKLHDLYGQALTQARQNAAQQTKDNPYPGHIIANTLAGVVANPEYFLAPGMSAGSTVGARIATAGATNAGIAAASDAAAQGMDMLEGQQKDYDVGRSLEQAAVGGFVGSALHGAGEATPFVKGLFKNRGMDTTPGENPAGTTSPLSPDQLQINKEDEAQYHELLRTGDVDDIKNFFKGKQGPQPSWTDVNNWVNHRDLASQNVQDTHLQPEFDYGKEYHRQAVEQHIGNITQGWKNAPDIEVIHSADDVQDPTVREQLKREDTNQTALGLLGSDGKVRIFGSRIPDVDTANSVLYHEALGHYGLAEKFGTDLDARLKTLADRNVGQFGVAVDKWQKANPTAYNGSRVRAAEEVLAEMSQKGTIKPTVSDAVSAGVRQFGRKMGLKLGYSDGEVKQILAMAHDAVINGKPNAVANGFGSPLNLEGTGSEKFMYKNALGQDQVDPSLLDHIDRLKQDPRFWSDPVFRKNVIELARTRGPVDTAPKAEAPKMRTEAEYRAQNKFMMTGPKARTFDENDRTAFTPSDGQPRNEISDKGAKLTGMKMGTLGDILDHPALYDQYPELRNMRVVHRAIHEDGDQWLGAYDPKTKTMHLDNTGLDDDPLKTVLHETQHAVQHIEGRLGDEDSTTHLSDHDYHNHPTEVEARSTEYRQGMTTGERAAAPPKYITREQLERSQHPNADITDEALERTYKALQDEVDNRPERSWAEDRRTALELGVSPSAIKDLGQTNPGDRSTRVMRTGLATQAMEARIASLEDKLDTPDWTLEDNAKYLTAILEKEYLVKRLWSETSEAARALKAAQAFKNYSLSNMKEIGEQLRELQSGTAGLAEDPEAFLKFARSVKALRLAGNPKGAMSKIAGVNKPYWEQYLTSLHMNMMLSAMSTHVKAPIDMGTGIARNVIEKVVALPISKARQLVGGKPGMTYAEIEGHLYGMIRAITDGEVYKATAHAAKTGEGSFVVNGQRTPSNFANAYGTVSNPRIPGASIPTDMISAQDTYFRSVEMSSQLYALGRREALDQLGHKASIDDIRTLGDNIARNPTLSMLREAHDLADRTLLLNSNKLNALVDKAASYRPGMTVTQRVGAFVVKNLAPFIRVESNNLMNRVIERSPLAFLSKFTRDEIRAGGARRDIAIAKIAYGTALLGMYWTAADAKKDKLTGEGPANIDKFKELMAGGFAPRSVHENGRYTQANSLANSLNPFDLHNSTATMVAGVREAYDEGVNKGQVGTGIKLALGAIIHDLGEMTWLSDAAPVSDALTARGTSAGQKVNQFIGNEAKTWVPNILGQTARLTDPYQHDLVDPNSISGTIKNEVQSAIPGLSKGLPTKQSVYGDPVPNGASITGIHTWLPGGEGNGRKEITEPTEKELSRLAKLSPAAIITPVQRTVKIDNPDDPDGDQISKKLTAAEFENYQHLAGRAIVNAVHDRMQEPDWASMSDKDRIDEIRTIQRDTKADVRDDLFGQQ